MGALRWTALLIAVLLRSQGSSGSSVHSLRYFYTGVSEPGQGLPRFMAVDYVDGQLTTRYDSNTRKKEPRAPWMEKVTEEDPHYWERYTEVLRGAEETFRASLANLRERYNQSGGLHTLQLMYGCELSGDNPSGGHEQYAYDVRDFIALDKETLTWTAAVPPAVITKNKWEAEPAIAQRKKVYLEEICIEWLRRYLQYGKEMLLRKEPPAVKVTRKDSQEGLETLLCQAHGFYPKEIDITWRKDGQVRLEDTFHGVVSPNSDGTYYTWLSIEIERKDRSRYRCHVEHDGLQDPLDVAVQESVPVWIIIIVGLLLVVLAILAVAGVILHIRTRQKQPTKQHQQMIRGPTALPVRDLLLEPENRAETTQGCQAVNGLY